MAEGKITANIHVDGSEENRDGKDQSCCQYPAACSMFAQLQHQCKAIERYDAGYILGGPVQPVATGLRRIGRQQKVRKGPQDANDANKGDAIDAKGTGKGCAHNAINGKKQIIGNEGPDRNDVSIGRPDLCVGVK